MLCEECDYRSKLWYWAKSECSLQFLLHELSILHPFCRAGRRDFRMSQFPNDKGTLAALYWMYTLCMRPYNGISIRISHHNLTTSKIQNYRPNLHLVPVRLWEVLMTWRQNDSQVLNLQFYNVQLAVRGNSFPFELVGYGWWKGFQLHSPDCLIFILPLWQTRSATEWKFRRCYSTKI